MVINGRKALNRDYKVDLDNEYELISGDKPVRLRMREAVQSVVQAVEEVETRLLKSGANITELHKAQSKIILDGSFDDESPDLSMTVCAAVVQDFLNVMTCGRL